jgi:hypothetical protein
MDDMHAKGQEGRELTGTLFVIEEDEARRGPMNCNREVVQV